MKLELEGNAMRLDRILFVLVIAALLGSCSPSPKSGQDRENTSPSLGVHPAEVRDEIDRVGTNYMDALLTGNAKLFSECFTEKGAMLLPGGKVVQGRDSIFIAMRSAFQANLMLDGTSTTQELFIVDENAFELGTWTGRVRAASAKSATADSGTYTRIWKRDDKRAWKVWRDIVRPWPLPIGA